MEDTSPAHRAPAVTRATMVLRLLAGERSGLGVTEVARRADIVPSTALHVLRALVDEGLVEFDNDKKTYRTGIGLLTLVRESMAHADFPRAAQPVLEGLAYSHRVTAVAVELDNRGRMVVVGLARPDNFVSLHVSIGSRFAPFISATGRCVAAASGLGREVLKERFDDLKWERAPRFDDWYADVQRAAVEGYAVDHGSLIRGVTVVSALLPVGIDNVLRAIALIGFDHHLNERAIRPIKDDLLVAVKSVSATLA